MYKLVLSANREDVVEAFHGVTELNRLMFEPFTILDSAQAAIAEINRNGADAVALDPQSEDGRALLDHLNGSHPHLPVIRSTKTGADLRSELQLLREHLDQMHGDFSDSDNDVAASSARLHAEFMHRLLEGKIKSKDELEAQLLLTRSVLSADYPCFLFEFDLPEGEQYLESRWHHGFERLDYALRANFFARINGALHYFAALVSPVRLRVLSCSQEKLTEAEIDVMSRGTHDRVISMAEQVKTYMDLDLVCAQFRALPALADLITRVP